MFKRCLGFLGLVAIGVGSFGAGCIELGVQTNGTTGVGGAGGAGGSSTSGSGGGGVGGAMAADWWDPAWSNRVRLTFQNTGGEALTDFPLMVRLDAGRIEYSKTADLGADLRFIDSDGKTILSHEIERWNAGGDSVIWVRVPTIDASNTDHIWLYYGNIAAADSQSPTAVWKDFIGVYHLSPSMGVPTTFGDSAGGSPGIWGNDNAGAIVPGQMNDAIGLDGTQFVHIGDNSAVAADPGEARTIEAWVNTEKLLEQFIVYEEGECVGWYLGTNLNSEYVGSFITDMILPPCGSGNVEYKVATPVSPGIWTYATMVIDRPGLKMSLFIDGILTSQVAVDNTGIADGNGLFRIGSDHDGGYGSFVGSIDEVRVSNSARSPAWISAQHKSMTDTFVSFSVD